MEISRAFPEYLLVSIAPTSPLESLWSFASRDLRVQYGLAHLPAALVWTGLAAVVAIFASRAVFRITRIQVLSSPASLAMIAATFVAAWLPAWWRGGLVMDDWRLLAAASIRKSVLSHPLLSFRTLDSVDGNFRPLSTVLYFGYMFRWVGAAGHMDGSALQIACGGGPLPTGARLH